MSCGPFVIIFSKILKISVLGAQANSHTSITGHSGSAKNTQIDFFNTRGRRYQNSRRFKWESKISKCYRKDKDALGLCPSTRSLANAITHDFQHGKHCRL